MTHTESLYAGFPLVLLLVFLGVAVSLEGSQEGIDTYLAGDWSVLIDRPEVWAKAVSLFHFDDISYSMTTFHL